MHQATVKKKYQHVSHLHVGHINLLSAGSQEIKKTPLTEDKKRNQIRVALEANNLDADI